MSSEWGDGSTGEVCWVFWLVSCDVHEAGEKVNREDGVDGSEMDDDSSESELLRVEGTKRS
jgi:hypothetical protein